MNDQPPNTLRPGDAAPDLVLPEADGGTVRLADLWAGQPLVLQFLRHLGCTFCRRQVVSLRDHAEELSAADCNVAIVAPADSRAASEFKRRFRIPYPLLCDERRQAYRAYGLRRGNAGQVLGPRIWGRGLWAFLRHGAGKPSGDLRQLPGAFVIDTAGTVRWVHYAADSADDPTPACLLQEVAACGSELKR